MQDQTQIFGIRAVIEAINAGQTIDKVFLGCKTWKNYSINILESTPSSTLKVPIRILKISKQFLSRYDIL